jgi:hypothetical protein
MFSFSLLERNWLWLLLATPVAVYAAWISAVVVPQIVRVVVPEVVRAVAGR